MCLYLYVSHETQISSGFRFALEENVRVDDAEERCANHWEKQEPQGIVGEECADQRQRARNFEQLCAYAVGFVPDHITGKRPRSADANEKIPLRFADHEPQKDEQQSHGG